jgi:hypothetical protein
MANSFRWQYNNNMSSKTFKHSVSPVTLASIGNLTREELSALAKQANVPVGKSKSNTISNLATAIGNGKLQVKSLLTITLPPAIHPTSDFMPRHGRTVLVKKFRSYRPDKVIVAPPKA